MRIETIAEHLVDVDLLPEKANILDIGCRGWHLSKYFTLLGHNVFAVDADPFIIETYCESSTAFPGFYYVYFNDRTCKFKNAAISGENGLCGIKRTNDPQATTILKANIPLSGFDIPMYTLENFSKLARIEFWDYIKTDVEGSEYEIIMSLTKAPAMQFECEFHLHTGVYTEKEVEEMVNKLVSLGYKIASHEKTSQHGLPPNFWSSLFTL